MLLCGMAMDGKAGQESIGECFSIQSEAMAGPGRTGQDTALGRVRHWIVW